MTRINLYYGLFLSLFVVFSNPALAQTALCNGSLGNPVINIDFGRGAAQHGAEITESNFSFVGAGTPEDGWYTIAKSTDGMYSGIWHQIGNHTANDPNGYMMIVNASYDPSVFYEAPVSNLCANTTYEFAAWIINLLTYSGNKPNLTFTITTPQGSLLAAFNTGDIAEGAETDWLHPGFLFTTPANVTDVMIRIQNNGIGGNGNDIAIDDITFRPCGPIMTPIIDGAFERNKNLCVGEDKSFVLGVQVSTGVYTNPKFLWQEMDANGIWQNMSAETSNQFTKNFTNNARIGSYKYRLLAAEDGNINSPGCRTNSPEFELKVIPKPVPIVTPVITACVGDRINLSVNEAKFYSWSGPGFTSDERFPVIDNATVDMSGTYVVKLTNEFGCEATAEIAVTISPFPVAAIEPVDPICRGTPVPLNASGGTVYKWFPATGLSDPNIANPIARPDHTTAYTVTVSNGGCEASASITVMVNENASAFAGPDKKILEGQRVELEGRVGDHVNFYWSPAEGLDDPHKLNPVASPGSDITYTLNAVSTNGCSNAVDEVFVRVYKKLIIPNSFSPNGDSVNDLWNITAIGAYPGAKVTIVNRYGRLLFESSGYEKPWDGKYGNQEVPVGVYYYLIDLNSELPALSGSLMVIR